MLIFRSCQNSRYLWHDLAPRRGSYLSYSKILASKTVSLFTFSQKMRWQFWSKWSMVYGWFRIICLVLSWQWRIFDIYISYFLFNATLSSEGNSTASKLPAGLVLYRNIPFRGRHVPTVKIWLIQFSLHSPVIWQIGKNYIGLIKIVH